jgi:hypothetical protein
MHGTKKETRTNAVLVTSSILLAAGIIAASFGLSAAFGQQTTNATTPTANSSPPISLKTDNGSVQVVVNWSPKEIKQGTATQFTISFQDPSTGTPLQHVNYNFEVKDANRNTTIQSQMAQHVHNGQATQTVTFDKPGNFQLVTTVIGLGLSQPFDTSKSGTAQTTITVTSGNSSSTSPSSSSNQGGVGGPGSSVTMPPY